jgi:putative oxidoreductase
MSMSGNARPMLPALSRLYPQWTELALLLLRLTAGLELAPRVWGKIMVMGPTAVATNIMQRRGMEPTMFFAYAAIIIETIGVVCITLGLFTRAAALLLVIEFIFIVYSHLTMQGWNVANGAEFPFLWLVVYIVFLCRGGGPYSVDAKMSREL